MWSRYKKFITEINIISHDRILFVCILTPLIIIILLRLIFPLLSPFIFSKSGFDPDSYYPLIAITLISFIPVIIGLVYSLILPDKKILTDGQVNEGTQVALRNLLYMRMIISSFLCFILVLMTIILTKPVPSEGWLRTLFAAFLFSIQTTFVFLFTLGLAKHKRKGLTLTGFYFVFLMTVPLGLLLHHPWNYLAFFSPLYWVVWSWIVQSPAESLIYGSIALIITSGAIILFLRNILRTHPG